MISRCIKWSARIAILAGALVPVAASAQTAGIHCTTYVITRPYSVNSQYEVTESEMLKSCFDSYGYTMHIVSPTMPYTIDIYAGGGTYPSAPFQHTVTDGHGNYATQTLQINRTYP